MLKTNLSILILILGIGTPVLEKSSFETQNKRLSVVEINAEYKKRRHSIWRGKVNCNLFLPSINHCKPFDDTAFLTIPKGDNRLVLRSNCSAGQPAKAVFAVFLTWQFALPAFPPNSRR